MEGQLSRGPTPFSFFLPVLRSNVQDLGRFSKKMCWCAASRLQLSEALVIFSIYKIYFSSSFNEVLFNETLFCLVKIILEVVVV